MYLLQIPTVTLKRKKEKHLDILTRGDELRGHVAPAVDGQLDLSVVVVVVIVCHGERLRRWKSRRSCKFAAFEEV